MDSFWSQFNRVTFEKRQCTDYDSALDYKQSLLARGFAYAEVAKENGKYFVKYRRY